MPIAVACAQCLSKMKAPDNAAGRRLKCPKCGGGVEVPGAAVNTAIKAGATAAAARKPSAPPNDGADFSPVDSPAPSPALIPVACPGCQAKFKAKPELTGKTLTCPKCKAKVIVPTADEPPESPEPPQADEATFSVDDAPVPAAVPPKSSKPAANRLSGWIDITEPYRGNIQPLPSTPRQAGVVGDWGDELIPEDVPDEMRQQIRDTLTRGERLVWSDRPRMDILLARAKTAMYVGIGIAVVTPLIIGGICYLVMSQGGWLILAGCLIAFLGLAFTAAGIYMALSPGRTRKNAALRSVFALTNRRVVIVPGKGGQTYAMSQSHGGRSSSRSDTVVGADAQGVSSYTGPQIMALRRVQDKKFPGCGDLAFSKNLFDLYGTVAIQALGEIADVEKRIRSTLIDPIADKLLSGELSLKAAIGEQKAKKEQDAELLPPEGNLKEFVSKSQDSKAAAAYAKRSLAEIADDLREHAEAELTEGERLVWIGEPAADVKERGLMNVVGLSNVERREPEYSMYAITNRRVLLWTRPAATFGKSKEMFDESAGPISYYPPAVVDCSSENDKRIDKGGSLIFRKVVLRIKTKKENGKDSRGRTVYKIVEKIEHHYFGILRIDNVQTVGRILFETLIRPVKQT